MKISPFIVGHVRCAFTPWPGFRHLVFAEQGALTPKPDDFLLPGYHDLQELTNTRTSEYFYLFGLRRAIQQNPSQFGDAIMIVHHRRFLADRPLGTPSSNVTFARTIPPDQAERLNPCDLLPPKSQETGWYVGTPVPFDGGMISQFALVHPIADFLRFLACAVDIGVLPASLVPPLLAIDALVPAPSVSLLPTQTFVRLMVLLEACARHFLTCGFREYEGYQRRIIGFCLERLHSCLMIAEINRLKLDFTEITGTQTVVNDKGDLIEASY